MAHLFHTLAKIGYAELPMDDFISIQSLFHKTFRKQYPFFKAKDTTSLEWEISKNELKPNEKQIRTYVLTSTDKCWGAIISPENIIFHTKNYTSIEDFWQRLEALLQFIDEQLQIDLLEYIGIRYFNQLKTNEPADLANLIKRPDVLQPLLHCQPSMSGSTMLSRYENDHGHILLRSGIVINEPPYPAELHPLVSQLESNIDSQGVNVVIDIDSFYSPERPQEFDLKQVWDKMYCLRTQAKSVYIEIVEDLDE